LKTFKRSTRRRLGTTQEDFKTTQRSAGVPSILGMIQSTLENFQLVELGDAQGLLAKAIKITRRHPARLQCTRGLVVWTSLGPLLRWVPGPTTRWAPGTTQLGLHGTSWRGAQGLQRDGTRLGSYTCLDPCKVLLAVHD
jgi:hypothetical protein